jgi:hypothetical protein
VLLVQDLCRGGGCSGRRGFLAVGFGEPRRDGAAVNEAEEDVALDQNAQIESFRQFACDG